MASTTKLVVHITRRVTARLNVAVQTVKKLLKQAEDPWVALLNYRAAPLPWCNLSPDELLMGRRLRTTVPVTDTQLIPKWPYIPSFCKKEREFKRKQASGNDHRHRTHLQSTLEDEENVWVTTGDEMVKGQIRGQANTPRSYYVDIPSGQVRRNRSHLKPIPREQEKEEEDDDDGNTEEIQDNSSEPKTIKTGKEPNTIRSPIMTKDSNWN